MAYYRIGRDALGRAVIKSRYEAPDERGPNVMTIPRLCAIADERPRKRGRRAPVLTFRPPADDGPRSA